MFQRVVLQERTRRPVHQLCEPLYLSGLQPVSVLVVASVWVDSTRAQSRRTRHETRLRFQTTEPLRLSGIHPFELRVPQKGLLAHRILLEAIQLQCLDLAGRRLDGQGSQFPSPQ